jgi:diguanylate cyclase (GGDEF)-like protein
MEVFTLNQMSESPKSTEKKLLERLAEENGLAAIIADGKDAPVDGANNNSMCRILYRSEEFAPRCDAFCGKAFEWATEAGKPVGYECHAGLDCLAVPVKGKKKDFVVIVGRTFLKAANYRKATERAITGDWSKFPPTRFFENVLLTGSVQQLEKFADRLEKLSDEEKLRIFEAEETAGGETENAREEAARQPEKEAETPASKNAGFIENFQRANVGSNGEDRKKARKDRLEAEEISAWRSLFGSLLKLDHHRACGLILDFLQKRYDLNSVAWLEQKENRLEPVLASGELREKQIKIAVSADDKRLLDAALQEKSLELRERKNSDTAQARKRINLFPIAVGGEIRSALAVADKLENEEIKRKLAHFCHTVAPELEILRLREELSMRNRVSRAVQKFNEGLRKIDTEDFWLNLTQISAELLRAERASLLIFNEKANNLQAKAVIGAVNDISREEIGTRVAQTVLDHGKPLVVSEIKHTGIKSAPPDWQYKTDSFISYPIAIGERKIAVLNFTDRVDREKFGYVDLELLQAITPQLAVAIDRASLKDIAGEFEQLSVTDALTGLLNRRYLEKRLNEEINRSNRHGFPMSFMMIDVDFFKSYNDNFGHAEGDKALKMVGTILKESLRGADVAARFGGEEFSILLPQTTTEEAETIAERIRRRVSETVFPKRQVTVSIGIASCSPEINSPGDLIEAADEALYEAKRQGRNKVQIFNKLPDTNTGG